MNITIYEIIAIASTVAAVCGVLLVGLVAIAVCIVGGRSDDERN